MHPSPSVMPPIRPTSLRQEVATALQAQISGLERRLLRNRPVSLAQLALVGDCLASFPCASGEYSRALNRLRNAIAYYRGEEFGAARYELMALVRELKPLIQAA